METLVFFMLIGILGLWYLEFTIVDSNERLLKRGI